ncbi:hypothetical protein [Phenylobacterium aquaticum]|uniref:hypothetical protein n=1 Tax=Phenylobacterium aquaticum TaxID=1763816 RepID=UPI001F5CC331|nr:hypothetical protein [Phenylobacterium aquaticum]MCI3131552.1 hypothetical protein [Phenylobacterium aquaticum]
MRVAIGELQTRPERQEPLAWLPAALIGLVALSIAAVAQAGARDAATAAGVFPPWWSRSAVLDAASQAGGVVAVGGAPFIVIIHSASGPAAPRLRAAGALVALDAGLARLCGA